LQGIFATSPLALVSLDEITDNVVPHSPPMSAQAGSARPLGQGAVQELAKGAYAMTARHAPRSAIWRDVYLAAVLRRMVAG